MSQRNLTSDWRSLEVGYVISLAGVIDEHSGDAMIGPETDRPVVFDLAGVRRITSAGVLYWRKALGELQASSYSFARARPAVVRQFNMVAGFGARGTLLSMYAPYYCEECDLEFQRLHDLAADPRIMLNKRLPITTCKQCGNEAELDGSLEGYLAFADDYAVPKMDAVLRRLVSALPASEEDGEDASDELEARRVAEA